MSTNDNNKKCPTCRYYERRKSTKDGLCRIRPPWVVTEINIKGVGSPKTSWPIVGDTDWCGDYEAAR